MKMRVGVSTACFYPAPTEEALLLAARSGAPCTEIFINADSEFCPSFFDRLAASAKGYQMEVVSIHPFTSGFEPIFFFSDYPRRMQDGLEMYRRFFELAARIGARYFVLHGARAQAALPEEELFERFMVLRRLAAGEGVRLLQENVARCKSRSPDFIRHMRAYLGSEAEFVLDTKQALRSGFSIEQMCQAMGEGMRHVHISDYSEEKDCVLPGKGKLDITALSRMLSESGYVGDMVLEVYRDSYGEVQELFSAYQYLGRAVQGEA